MKWSPSTKSAAGICKHKTSLPLNLKPNWIFGKGCISGQRNDHIRPRGVSRRTLGSELLELSHCPGQHEGPGPSPGQKKSGFYRETFRRHTDGRAVEQEDKPGNHTQNSETPARNWGPPSRDPLLEGSRKVHASCTGPWEQNPL